jgi:lysozyme family protein
VDAFEKVWEFTLKHEVSPLWMSDGTWNPSNPEVAQGLVTTPIQRQHVGFNTNANDPGGSTKFGVAQKYNANIKIADMDYATARTTAFNTYWNASDNPCVGLSPKIAAIVFDMNYSIGVGGSKKVMTDAGVNGTEMLQSELDALDKLTTARIAYLKTKSGWSTFGTGWTKRSNDCLAFAKTV